MSGVSVVFVLCAMTGVSVMSVVSVVIDLGDEQNETHLIRCGSIPNMFQMNSMKVIRNLKSTLTPATTKEDADILINCKIKF
jgi:hypothetical protein